MSTHGLSGARRFTMSTSDGQTAITLSEALPFTVASGDIAHPTITPYWVSSVLKDAVTGPSTFHWFFKKAKTGTDLLWTVEGSVASFKLDGIARTSASNTIDNAAPGLSLKLTGTNSGAPTQVSFSDPSAGIITAMQNLTQALNAVVGELHTARAPNANCAAFATTVLSTPPENATAQDFNPAMNPSNWSRLRASSGGISGMFASRYRSVPGLSREKSAACDSAARALSTSRRC